MPAIELIGGYVTAPDTTETNLTMNSGNSLTVRNFDQGSNAYLMSMWARVQGAGVFKVRSPFLHDNVQGIRFQTNITEPKIYLHPKFLQKLIPQDSLVASLSGSATGGDIELAAMLIYYDRLPGLEGRFTDFNSIKNRIKNIVTATNSITGGTSGNWAGEVVLNASYDLFKGNTDYALLGYQVNVSKGSIRWRGTDIGNLGIGGPADSVNKHLTNRWFVYLSEESGLPCIPIFNSANKSSIYIDAQNDENAATFVVNSIFGEL